MKMILYQWTALSVNYGVNVIKRVRIFTHVFIDFQISFLVFQCTIHRPIMSMALYSSCVVCYACCNLKYLIIYSVSVC